MGKTHLSMQNLNYVKESLSLNSVQILCIVAKVLQNFTSAGNKFQKLYSNAHIKSGQENKLLKKK